jgi:hypothetical protein
MKLSQAIALGSTICKAGKYRKLGNSGTRAEGCGLEMAMEAVGDHRHWTSASAIWPWAEDYMLTMAVRFDTCVLTGIESLESFIDWVASIEPPEVCSECRSEQPVNEIQVCQECQP